MYIRLTHTYAAGATLLSTCVAPVNGSGVTYARLRPNVAKMVTDSVN